MEKQSQKQILLVNAFSIFTLYFKKKSFVLQSCIIVFFPANKQIEKRS